MDEFTPKEQENIMARDLIETDISDIPDAEFKAIIKRTLTGLEEKVWKTSERLTTKIRALKKKRK